MTTNLVMSITDEQIAEIEALASKATPGQWWIDSHGHDMVSLDDYQPIFSAKDLVKPAVRHPETGNLSHWPNDWDASYIATANPANILALISRLRAAERDAARLDKLDAIGYAYGFEDMHEGNRWMIDGPYRDIRAAIDDIQDTARKGDKQ